MVVECEQRVVDQIAEITGDVDAAELPVDDRQIDMRHEAQGLASVAPRRSRQYRSASSKAEGHKQGRTGCGDAYLLKLWVGRQRLQKRRLPMFNVTRGPVKGSEPFASCRGKCGVAQPH